MNILDQLQKLDDLIVEHTKPPVTSILRNQLHPIREQVEAYEKDAVAPAALKKAQHTPTSDVPGDTCPYCRQPTGQLQSMKPIPGLELHGLKTGYYKCSNPNCGKSYERQVKP